MKQIALFFLLISLTIFSGCSLFEPEFVPFTSPPLDTTTQPPAPEIREPVEVKVEQLPAEKQKESKSDAIILKWLVPAEAVDGYVVRYGFSANDLEYEERLNWSSLSNENDPVKGRLFVHHLQGIPRHLTVYISIAGVKDDQISKPTNIFSVSPANR